MNTITQLIRLMRPYQWIKNAFVFLPLFFSGNLYNGTDWFISFVGFISFSLGCSAIYCFNDIMDREADRLHPQKRFRPLASGKISVKFVIPAILVLLAGALAIPLLLGREEFFKCNIILVSYIVLNILYSWCLKRIAILDIIIIAIGFVLRVVWGGVACGIWLSPWIIIMTFLLTLFLALSKRRHEFLLLRKDNIAVRKSITDYNLDFINLAIGISAAVTIMTYILYTVSPEVTSRMHSDYLYLTSVFVIGGILRYLQICYVREEGGSPTLLLLRDKFLILMIGGWIFSFIFFLYL